MGLCELHNYVLERLTATWSTEDLLDLLARVDVILELLNPKAS